MKIFAGARREPTRHTSAAAVTVTDGKGTRMLPQRQDLYNHSPDGFEWGYHGSGPAQLALAVCAEVLQDDRRALSVYQDVKAALIATIVDDDWVITEEQVRAEVERIERSRP